MVNGYYTSILVEISSASANECDSAKDIVSVWECRNRKLASGQFGHTCLCSTALECLNEGEIFAECTK